MSLHTIVADSLAGRLRFPRAVPSVTRPVGGDDASMQIPSGSMRLLETGLAVAALATALLLGLAH